MLRLSSPYVETGIDYFETRYCAKHSGGSSYAQDGEGRRGRPAHCGRPAARRAPPLHQYRPGARDLRGGRAPAGGPAPGGRDHAGGGRGRPDGPRLPGHGHGRDLGRRPRPQAGRRGRRSPARGVVPGPDRRLLRHAGRGGVRGQRPPAAAALGGPGRDRGRPRHRDLHVPAAAQRGLHLVGGPRAGRRRNRRAPIDPGTPRRPGGPLDPLPSWPTGRRYPGGSDACTLGPALRRRPCCCWT